MLLSALEDQDHPPESHVKLFACGELKEGDEGDCQGLWEDWRPFKIS